MKKRTTRLIHVALLVAVLALLAAVILPAIRHTHVCGPRDLIKTRMDISAISAALSLYVREHAALPSFTTNVSPNAQLFADLLAADLISAEQGTNGIFVDHWGNPLHIRRKDRSVNTNGIITCDRSSVLIWSNGRNGQDEDSYGDDISAECFLGIKTVFRDGEKVVGVGQHYLPARLKSEHGE